MAITVLVVDDSALMRRYLRQMLEAEPDMRVITARDGRDALRQIEAHDPDVVTLDINMPVMDGLTCLAHIMSSFPRPVVMVSSLTEKGAVATFEALELGAVDYIPKPGGTVSLNIKEIGPELVAKVRAAARAKVREARRPMDRKPAAGRVARPARRPAGRVEVPGLVLVGVSTGGPRTLEEILPRLPADFPWPVLVAQHMPASFTRVFARRLDGLCALRVAEVDRPVPVEPGRVYLGRGDADVVVGKRLGRLVALSLPEDPQYLWHPSVDRMVWSALEHLPAERMIGVQLTGMGHDGAEAMTELRRRGGRTVAESEDTAVVFGMPRELIERGGAEAVLPADRIAEQLVAWCMDGARAAAGAG